MKKQKLLSGIFLIIVFIISFNFQVAETKADISCLSESTSFSSTLSSGNPPSSYPADVTVSWYSNCASNQLNLYTDSSGLGIPVDQQGSYTYTIYSPGYYGFIIAAFQGPPSGPEGICPLETRESCAFNDAMWYKSAEVNALSIPVPTVTVSVNKSFGNGTIYAAPGTYKMLDWSSTDAASCRSTWFNGTSVSGSQSVGPILQDTTYSATCTGSGGTGTGNITIKVTAPETPTGFTATAPTNPTCGSSWINIAWYKSTGATNYKVYRDGLIIYQGDGSDKVVGDHFVFSDSILFFGSSHTYTITASNTGGTSLVGNTSPTPSVVQSACPSVCTVTTDTNYGIGACLGTCKNGALVNTYPTCTTPPPPVCTVTTDTNYNIGPCLGTCKNGQPASTYPGCTPPPVCTVSTDTNYNIGPCLNSCKNGYTNYPTCTSTQTSCTPRPVITLNASPKTGTSPLTSVLTWTVSGNATSCTATGNTAWNGSKAVSNGTHTQTITGITAGTTYYLVCANAGGNSNTASAPVTPTGITDACGTDSGTTPKLNEPTTNPAACNPGTYANSPANITTSGSQAWRWSCGTVTSCTAPKYGCTTTTDINYNPTGPNNVWGCANKCNVTTDTNYNTAPCSGICTNGATNYSTCTNPPPTTATIKVSSNKATSWTINPGNITGSGTSKTHTVTPSIPASSYTIVADPVNGYSGPAISNDITNNSPTFSLSAGDTGIFNLTYSPIGCTNCPPGFNYSLSNSGMGVPAPGQVTITKTLTSGSPQSVFLSVSGEPTGITHTTPSGQSCLLSCSSVISFNVSPSTPNRTYPITVTGEPGSKTTTFNLVVDNGGGGGCEPNCPVTLNLSCSLSSPITKEAKIGDTVTWKVDASGGTPPYTSYRWNGSGIPIDHTTSVGEYSLTYSTVGRKEVNVRVIDSGGHMGECAVSGNAGVLIKFDPTTIQER